MDSSTLVGSRLSDGRRFVQQFVADGHPVRAAFWVKTEEDGLWFLHVATDLVDARGPLASYRSVHDSLRKLGEFCVPSSEIKVVSPGDPIARDVLALMARHPRRLVAEEGGVTLGSTVFDQIYVYPEHFFRLSPVDPASRISAAEIMEYLHRTGTVTASLVTLRDGTSFYGVPSSITVSNDEASSVTFHADGEPEPRVVELDDLVSIT